MQNNYTILHCHTFISNAVTNIDSVTSPNQMIDRAHECGMKAMAISEHGSVMNWVKKRLHMEELGMKYIHAEEFYLTSTLEEKIRDNYHCLLIAKNYDGVLEINKLSSKSFNREDNSFYYVPRITIEDVKNTSDNVIVSTACLGGVLNKAPQEIQNDFLDFLVKNKYRCYLELQPHLDKLQVEYNKKLWEISKKTGIPLLMCTDTHALNSEHVDGRRVLQKSKNIHFDGEDNFHLEFLTYDELVDLCRQQNALPMEVYIESIENTNRVADSIEEFSIDYSYKYPRLWGDKSLDVFKHKIMDGIKLRGVDKYPNYSEYIARIKHEIEAYVHNDAIDFMLLMEDIIDWCKTQGISVGYGRGSCTGSVIAYLLGITEMDSIKHNLNFERFMSTERVSLSDIDTDFPPERVNEVKNYIFNKHGLYCADIITFNTIALKGAIRDVGRAFDIPLDEVDDICNLAESDIAKAREKYPKLFKYVDLVNGCVVSVGNHPSGMIVAPYSIDDRMGIFTTTTDDVPISQINMKEVDLQNYVKLDLLKLDTASLINGTCELAGIARLTPDNIDADDRKVWDSIRDDTTAIFQWESASASRYIRQLLSDSNIEKFKKISPKVDYMTLLSIGNGAIRPAGESYRDDLANGIVRKSGCDAIDEFMKPTFGYLVFQCQIINFLHEFCGYTMGEADIVRRHFAKKTGTEKDIPQIQEGFAKTMKEKYNMEESESGEVIKAFIKVIEDASNYLFSLNHSQPYSYEGYAAGWLRYYYPLEFLTTGFNIWTDDNKKTTALTKYANKHRIAIKSAKFRHSTGKYTFDKENNCIYKGMGSIKHISADCADQLYSIRFMDFPTFTDLLVYLRENTTVDARQIKVLTTIGFFSEFGKNKKLLEIVDKFFERYKKTYVTKTKEARIAELKSFEASLPDEYLPLVQRIASDRELLGYVSFTQPELPKNFCFVLAIDAKYTPRVTLYCIATGKSIECKVDKKFYGKHKFKADDVLYCKKFQKRPNWRKTENGFEQTGTYCDCLVEYDVVTSKFA